MTYLRGGTALIQIFRSAHIYGRFPFAPLILSNYAYVNANISNRCNFYNETLILKKKMKENVINNVVYHKIRFEITLKKFICPCA